MISDVDPAAPAKASVCATLPDMDGFARFHDRNEQENALAAEPSRRYGVRDRTTGIGSGNPSLQDKVGDFVPDQRQGRRIAGGGKLNESQRREPG